MATNWMEQYGGGERPSDARALVKALGDRGINPSPATRDGIQRLQQITDWTPPPVHRLRVHDRLVGGQFALDAELADAVAMDLCGDHLAWSKKNAETTMAREVLQRLRDDQKIHKQLAELAQAAIANLERAAKVDAPLEQLVAERRNDEADLLVNADRAAADLTGLYRLRDDLLPGGRRWIGRLPVPSELTRWRDNKPLLDNGLRPAAFLEGLRAGGELYFADADGIQEHVAKVLAAHRAKQPAPPETPAADVAEPAAPRQQRSQAAATSATG